MVYRVKRRRETRGYHQNMSWRENETQSGAKAGTVKLDLYHVVGRHYLCRVQEDLRSIVCFQPAFRLSEGFPQPHVQYSGLFSFTAPAPTVRASEITVMAQH